MKYYIMAVVLIVALAGFGVQLLDSNTGMAVAPAAVRITDTVNWGVICSQLKTESNALAAEYESQQCYVYRGPLSNLICPNPGPVKTGYVFQPGSGGGTDAFTECKELADGITKITIQLEKNAEKSKDCSNILQGMRIPYGCSGKTRG
jgi:hypothetical protein